MWNYSNYRSSSDRFNISDIDEGTIESLARKLKYPLEDILCAVREVGCDREEVEEYIRDRHNRA